MKMSHGRRNKFGAIAVSGGLVAVLSMQAYGQLIDKTRAANNAQAGIAKSLLEQIGAGRGDWATLNSSSYLVARDPFRAIRRGRQLFQRKFTRSEGQGSAYGDGVGNINVDLAIGAGLADSCATCHGRPRGTAGSGGSVVTRPDSRDAPHLFGLGLKEMLADEITYDLRNAREAVAREAQDQRRKLSRALWSKGIHFGTITAHPDGSIDVSGVRGVDPDLRVRPFFSHGETISIREFIVGALKNEMGLEAVDPDLARAAGGGVVRTLSGMLLDGTRDKIEAPRVMTALEDPDGDGVVNEIPESIVDYLEFYLFNYFKPATYQQTQLTQEGRRLLDGVGCTNCHVANLTVERDRRYADVETVYDPLRGIFNGLFATASVLTTTISDTGDMPPVHMPRLGKFQVNNIFTDFKRHDLGPNFYELNYDGTIRTEFLTAPLWGAGTTAPYGHDGRSINLTEVILRHGGEAQAARDRFAGLQPIERESMLAFLNSLVLFPPDDTASNLDPGNRSLRYFPLFGHGSIRLTALFLNPADIE
jgi:hypothetical protein